MGQEIQLKLNNNNVSPTVEKVGDGNLQGFTATDLTGAANELKNTLSTLDSDITGPISLTGTNNTGTTILKGEFFYNNGVLVYATQNINANDSITIGTNAANAATEGALNVLNLGKTWDILQNNITSITWNPSTLSYSEYLFMIKTTTDVLASMVIPATVISNNITLKYITDSNVHVRLIKEGTSVYTNQAASDISAYGVIFAR